ncbi:ABC transporter permease subunit [Cnuibacter physcomitrellae]|uniref:ABC transporter permease n=1 Tax=Cnuibacter physcomitrellae TaxID=1619308 RepID=UPI002175FF1E|nr:ABC transporter permease subunit [Cnuibacter physcomitrellae]MCS5495687.1 ABC transporter permease subunit [Cnuibacter physcomitrellae]
MSTASVTGSSQGARTSAGAADGRSGASGDRDAIRAAAIATERSRSRRAARRGAINGWVTTLVVSLALLVLWEVAADLWLTRLGVIASPSAIVQSLIADAGLYWSNFTATAWVAIRGWFWGNLLAVLVAIVFVQVPAFESLFLRLALTLFCLPLVAVNPLLQLTFDPDTAKVVLTSLAVFFTTLVGTMLGLRSADGGPLTMVTAWGGGGLSKLRFVRFPSGIPAILTGLQIGAAAAALGAIFGEFIGAKSGLGVLLINGLMGLNLPRVWSVAVLVTLMAAVPYGLFGLLRRWLTPWSASISNAQAATASPRGSAFSRFATAVAWTIGSIVVILLAWWAYLIVFDMSPFVGKSPVDVFQYLFVSEEAAANRAVLVEALGVTLVHAGTGYIAGLVVGIAMAVAFVTVPVVERVLTPLAVALRSVPIIVLIPVLILALGRGLGGVVAITAIVTFFPTLANVQGGLKRVPSDAFTLMRSYDSSIWSNLWRVQLPYTLPAIFASARIAAPTAVLAATLAEWLATGDGLGHTIVTSRSHSDYTQLWAAAALLTAVSLVFYSLVSWAERVVLRRFAPSQVG